MLSGEYLSILLFGVLACSKKSTEPSNNPPQILSWSADSTRGCAPLKVFYSWNIQDPDNDNMTCEIDANGDGTPETTIPNCTSQYKGYSYTFNDIGSYTSKIVVKDSKGGFSSAFLNIKVCKKVSIVSNYIVELDPDSGYTIPFYAYMGDTLMLLVGLLSGSYGYLQVTDGSTLLISRTFSSGVSDSVKIPYTNTWKIFLGNPGMDTGIYIISAYLHRWP